MSRVGAEAENGSRRRLPSWMANVRKTDNGDAGISKEISDANSNPVVTCETKRRKSTRQGEEEAEIVTVMKKKKKKKKRYNGVDRTKKLKPKSDEIEDDDEDEDGEMTLTVEDLLIIAKEYVQADRDTVGLQSSNKDFESGKLLSATTCFQNDLRGSNDIYKLPTDSAVAFCTSNLSLTSDQSLLSSDRTGDPAQDMLDLFLGPLLKKPLEEETRTKFTRNDVDFSNGFSKRSQNDVGQENVPLIKTKSSLKDKVALLLD